MGLKTAFGWIKRVLNSINWNVFAVVVALSICGVLVFLEWSLIARPVLFWFLVFGLVMAAFVCSATEIAFALAPRDNDILDAINADLVEAGKALIPHQAKLVPTISPADKKELFRLLRQLEKIQRKEDRLKNSERDTVIGSLAAASVFLNTALTAFLPLTLVHQNPTGFLVYLPYLWLVADNNNVAVKLLYYEFTSSKILIFVASSIPILLFGKIVPKLVGARYPKLFAYDLHIIGAAMCGALGWLTRGIMVGIQRFIRK